MKKYRLGHNIASITNLFSMGSNSRPARNDPRGIYIIYKDEF
jgi:hypothetical protein